MKVLLPHRRHMAVALITTLAVFGSALWPASAALATGIGENDTAHIVDVDDRESLEDLQFYAEDEAIEVDGEIGLTPAEVKQQQAQLDLVETLGEPQEQFVAGEMWSDAIELPEGISKEEADTAEVHIANEDNLIDPDNPLRQTGAPCTTIWPKMIPVCGEILTQYNRLGGLTSWLLYPVEPQYQNPDGRGLRQKFANGWIYWSPETGAHAVARHTAAVWAANGWEAGWMGYPTTGEVSLNGNTNLEGELTGWVQQFQGGRIYRSQAFNGFHVASINGLILEKWLEMGGPDSPLGFPVANEAKTPDGQGRFSAFQAGSIYWHPAHGAHPVEGDILKKWGAAGYETGHYGYPIADAIVREGTTYADQRFQGGTISGELFMPIDSFATPYIYFPTEAEADEFFGKIEDILRNGGSSMTVGAAFRQMGKPRKYGPCTMYPHNFHKRTGSVPRDRVVVIDGEIKPRVTFKFETKCSEPVDYIKHTQKILIHHKSYIGAGTFDTLFTESDDRKKTDYFETKKFEVQCRTDKNNLFAGAATGQIINNGERFYARVFPRFARFPCGV
ncbi:LGFP repeat-containing protein [Corynebacterium lizhenjunii]|uniref:LGFP repeat-containing protein n=1 Tax=Corynebacterium lizhenjunii TaxID=2709394 RepID=UPI0013ECAED2|nr:hypothetical protein [Corynebacterium lizhenjunii]